MSAILYNRYLYLMKLDEEELYMDINREIEERTYEIFDCADIDANINPFLKVL